MTDEYDYEKEGLYEEIASLNNEIADLHVELGNLMSELDGAKQEIVELKAQVKVLQTVKVEVKTKSGGGYSGGWGGTP